MYSIYERNYSDVPESSLTRREAVDATLAAAVHGAVVLMLCYALYVVALWISYYAYIVPYYGYLGYRWSPNNWKVVEGLLVLLATVLLLPKSFDRPSSVFLHLQMLLVLVPMAMLYGAADASRYFFYASFIAADVMILVVRFVRLRGFSMPLIDSNSAAIILISIASLYILFIIAVGGLRYLNFNFEKVYEYRLLAAQQLPWLCGYITPFVGKVVIPFAVLLAVILRRKWLMLAGYGCAIMLFGLTSQKGPLFYPIVVVLVYLLSRTRHMNQLAITGAAIWVVLGSFLAEVSHMLFVVSSILVRRVFFVPAMLNYAYYDVFQRYGHVFWSESKLSLGALRYQYDLSLTHLVGYEILDSDSCGANTGWIGSGFAQAGVPGMILYAVIIGLVFTLIDWYALRDDKSIVAAIFLGPVLALIVSSDLPTALLTHGTIAGLLLFVLIRFPSDTDSEDSAEPSL